MYNNILRKLTSLTLLTILLASSAVVGLPNALPHAQAQATNANLFVSAENSQWNNYFAGPQVVQVVVSDPSISQLDQAYGEPVVTVNGKRLHMAQGSDGNWYAYFADRNQAIAAGNTAELQGKGLNFGGFCGPTSSLGANLGGIVYTDTKGFTIARGAFGSENHTGTARTPLTITSGNLPVCTDSQHAAAGNTGGNLSPGQMEYVVRENTTLSNNISGFASGKNMTEFSEIWPVIQTL